VTLDPLTSNDVIGWQQEGVAALLTAVKQGLRQTCQGAEVQGPVTLQQLCNLKSLSEQTPVTSDRIRVLNVPEVVVGYQEEWLRVTTPALHYWEKARFEPFSPKKHCAYYVISPANTFFSYDIASFFKQLSCVYEVCNLGTHQPGSRKTTSGQPGIFLLPTKGNTCHSCHDMNDGI
jgi:hypothetical protein